MKRSRHGILLCVALFGLAVAGRAELTLNLDPIPNPAGVLPTDSVVWFTGTFSNSGAVDVDIIFGDFTFDPFNVPAWADIDRILYDDPPGGTPPSLNAWTLTSTDGYLTVGPGATSSSFTLFGVLIANATLTGLPEYLQGWYQAYDASTFDPLLTANAGLGPLIGFEVVPEPASLGLLALAGLALLKRRTRRA